MTRPLQVNAAGAKTGNTTCTCNYMYLHYYIETLIIAIKIFALKILHVLESNNVDV